MGINSNTGDQAAKPFDSEGEIVEPESGSELDEIHKSVVTSAYDQADSLSANAEVSGSGWGASV